MECIKYSEDMYAMQQALAENDRFKNLDRKTSNVMRYCSKLKIDFEIDEEEFDMCKAFEDYKDLGKSEGREEGIEEGELKKGISTAISMIRDNLSDDKITLYTDLPLSSVQIIRQQLDNGIDDAKKIMQLL